MVVKDEKVLKKIQEIDELTNEIIETKIMLLPYFKSKKNNPRLSKCKIELSDNNDIIDGATYNAKKNRIYINKEDITVETLLREKIILLLYNEDLKLSGNITNYEKSIEEYIGTCAAEWLRCRVMYGKDFLKTNSSNVSMIYIHGVTVFQTMCDFFGENKLMLNFFDENTNGLGTGLTKLQTDYINSQLKTAKSASDKVIENIKSKKNSSGK